MANRVTQSALEVLGTTAAGDARVTQSALEVLGRAGSSDARVTQSALEVLCRVGSFEFTQTGAQDVFSVANGGRATQAGDQVSYACRRDTWITQAGTQVVWPTVPAVEVSDGPGFWIANADPSGSRLSGSEVLLSGDAGGLAAPVNMGPGPSEVEYPRALAKPLVETAAGSAVKQQPSADPRQRAWIWRALPTGDGWLRYDRLVRHLETLLAKTRQAAGLPEEVYIRDNVTSGLRKWVEARGAPSAATSTTLVDGAAHWTPDRFQAGVVEILSGTGVGQRRGILSNTATTLYVDRDWDVVPSTDSAYRIRMSWNTWVKVRVINVPKMPTARATVEQMLRFEFIVTDPDVDDWG
jgi:hypothetical protein